MGLFWEIRFDFEGMFVLLRTFFGLLLILIRIEDLQMLGITVSAQFVVVTGGS